MSQVVVDSSLVGKTIVSITIEGNKRTRPYIIQREMTQTIGQPMDPGLLELDRQRILNLNLFQQAVITTNQVDGLVAILVSVKEIWYIFPYPIFFINERDWKNLSYGAGVTHINFRGRAEILSIQSWFGYNPSLRLDYTNPWFGEKHQLSTHISLFFDRIRSKHYVDQMVTERHIGTRWRLGKRFGNFFSIEGMVGYKEVTLTPKNDEQTPMQTGRDRLPCLGLTLQWDSRDTREYAHTGLFAEIHAEKKGMPGKRIDYWRTGFDMRAYCPLPWQTTFAVRAASDLSSGDIPTHDFLYLGYDQRVRGHFSKRRKGDNRFIGSASLRIPLIPLRPVTIPGLTRMKDIPFGVSAALFVDTGCAWFGRSPLRTIQMLSGFGCGLHFRLPYIQVIRFETAFDGKGHAEFIVDLFTDI